MVVEIIGNDFIEVSESGVWQPFPHSVKVERRTNIIQPMMVEAAGVQGSLFLHRRIDQLIRFDVLSLTMLVWICDGRNAPACHENHETERCKKGPASESLNLPCVITHFPYLSFLLDGKTIRALRQVRGIRNFEPNFLV